MELCVELKKHHELRPFRLPLGSLQYLQCHEKNDSQHTQLAAAEQRNFHWGSCPEF